MSMRNPQNERYTVEREGRSQGSVKPRTASAKPASKAGASVRTTSKPKPKNANQRAMAEMNMSKEEKKAARAKEREAENVAYTAIDILTRKDARYKKRRRIWWIVLAIGMVLVVAIWASLYFAPAGMVSSPVQMVGIVLSYVIILGDFIYDFVRIRPLRNMYRTQAEGMSDNKLNALIERSAAEEDKKDSKKK